MPITPPGSPVLKRSSALPNPELLDLAANASGTRAVQATAPRVPGGSNDLADTPQVMFHGAEAGAARTSVAEHRATEVQDLLRGRQLWAAGPEAMTFPELEKFRDDLRESPSASYATTRVLIGLVQDEIAKRGI